MDDDLEVEAKTNKHKQTKNPFLSSVLSECSITDQQQKSNQSDDILNALSAFLGKHPLKCID